MTQGGRLFEPRTNQFFTHLEGMRKNNLFADNYFYSLDVSSPVAIGLLYDQRGDDPKPQLYYKYNYSVVTAIKVLSMFYQGWHCRTKGNR